MTPVADILDAVAAAVGLRGLPVGALGSPLGRRAGSNYDRNNKPPAYPLALFGFTAADAIWRHREHAAYAVLDKAKIIAHLPPGQVPPWWLMRAMINGHHRTIAARPVRVALYGAVCQIVIAAGNSLPSAAEAIRGRASAHSGILDAARRAEGKPESMALAAAWNPHGYPPHVVRTHEVVDHWPVAWPKELA